MSRPRTACPQIGSGPISVFTHWVATASYPIFSFTVLAGNGKAEFSGDGGPPGHSSLNYPFGVAVDTQGQVYIADTFSHRIRVVVK